MDRWRRQRMKFCGDPEPHDAHPWHMDGLTLRWRYQCGGVKDVVATEDLRGLFG